MESNNHGGARKGAGRKSNKEIFNIRQQLDESIDSKFVVEKLFQLINNGDMRAIELYLKYRFGNPTKSIDVTMDTVQDLNFHLEDVLSFKKIK